MRPSQVDSTLRRLRAAGHKVRVTHYRMLMFEGDPITMVSSEDWRKKNWMPGTVVSPTGGKVSVTVTTRDGRQFEGLSECAMADNFKKRQGTAIALGRCLEEMRKAGKWQ